MCICDAWVATTKRMKEQCSVATASLIEELIRKFVHVQNFVLQHHVDLLSPTQKTWSNSQLPDCWSLSLEPTLSLLHIFVRFFGEARSKALCSWGTYKYKRKLKLSFEVCNKMFIDVISLRFSLHNCRRWQPAFFLSWQIFAAWKPRKKSSVTHVREFCEKKCTKMTRFWGRNSEIVMYSQ